MIVEDLKVSKIMCCNFIFYYWNIIKFYFTTALDTLKEQSNAELWETFAPELIDAETKATLNAIRCLIRPLDPCKLLPALVAAENSQVRN